MLLSLVSVLAVVSPILYILNSYLPNLYIFSPNLLQQISQNAITIHSTNTTALLDQIVLDLRSQYGDAINPIQQSDWFFNNAGGAMGSMVILHASISEYLIFFGTPIGTEGHSGIHLADDYFTILVGEQHVAYPGDLQARIYKPGMQNHLKRGERVQYVMPSGGCWALELAQGWIPSMLPFGFADTFSSTLDFGNLWKTIEMTALAMGRQALRGKF